jgi:hypothetical protein
MVNVCASLPINQKNIIGNQITAVLVKLQQIFETFYIFLISYLMHTSPLHFSLPQNLSFILS